MQFYSDEVLINFRETREGELKMLRVMEKIRVVDDRFVGNM